MLPNFSYSSREICLPMLPDVSASADRISLALFDESSTWKPAQAYQSTAHTIESDDSLWEPLCRLSQHQGGTCIADPFGAADEAVLIGRPEFFAPQRWTETTLESVSRNVQRIQHLCEPMRFFLESSAYLCRQESEMNEVEFLSRILTRTGCGWLLNLTGVYANAQNFRFDPYDFLAEVLPAAHRTRIQLTGGYFDVSAGMYFDSPSDPIPDDVWCLYRFALTQARHKIEAVFVQHDPRVPHDPAWQQEIDQARRMTDAALRVSKHR